LAYRGQGCFSLRAQDDEIPVHLLECSPVIHAAGELEGIGSPQQTQPSVQEVAGNAQFFVLAPDPFGSIVEGEVVRPSPQDLVELTIVVLAFVPTGGDRGDRLVAGDFGDRISGSHDDSLRTQ